MKERSREGKVGEGGMLTIASLALPVNAQCNSTEWRAGVRWYFFRSRFDTVYCGLDLLMD